MKIGHIKAENYSLISLLYVPIKGGNPLHSNTHEYLWNHDSG